MAFEVFNTTTATMKKITTDGYGDQTVASSFTVEIDPVLGKKNRFDDEGEIYTGLQTIITAHDSIDVTHDKWQLEYNGRNYQIEEMLPMYSIGGNVLEHVEVVLR